MRIMFNKKLLGHTAQQLYYEPSRPTFSVYKIFKIIILDPKMNYVGYSWTLGMKKNVELKM